MCFSHLLTQKLGINNSLIDKLIHPPIAHYKPSINTSISGIMDLELIDYELGFNVTLLGMDKASRLRTGESQMTHAMVLTGVHIDERSGETVRWRVQNSWGTDAGVDGWFVMSEYGRFVRRRYQFLERFRLRLQVGLRRGSLWKRT